jgi:glyoxalase family protein
MQLLGLHHITAIAADPKTNLDFYTRVLGLRFVKKSVNQDDPGTYHLYYGDNVGSPGTALTFFPWQGLRRGRPGAPVRPTRPRSLSRPTRSPIGNSASQN